MQKKYAALIFDVIESRKIQDRYEVQSELKNVTKILNNLYKYKIIKNVVCGAGDEFQGLFKTPADAYAYIHSLQLYIHPIRVRCGIGYGSIRYETNKWVSDNDWSSTDINGEAYYSARDAINAIPDKNATDVVFFKTNTSIDKTLNTIMLTGAGLKKAQSKTAKLIELIMDFYFPFNQTNIDDNVLCEFSKIIENKIREIWKDQSKRIYNLGAIKRENLSLHDSGTSIKDLVFNTFYYRKSVKTKGNDYYFEEYYPYGCSTLIAPLTMSTPQNISKTIILGKIKENRNLDGAVFNLLVNIDDIGDKEKCY